MAMGLIRDCKSDKANQTLTVCSCFKSLGPTFAHALATSASGMLVMMVFKASDYSVVACIEEHWKRTQSRHISQLVIVAIEKGNKLLYHIILMRFTQDFRQFAQTSRDCQGQVIRWQRYSPQDSLILDL